MGKNKISVIVPVYNAEKTLERCVESTLGQTWSDLELILIDDGSTDRSPSICDAYQAKDERVRVVHQPNAGVSAARNRGLNMAQGAYIAWVDADDWMDTEMLERLYLATQEEHAEIAVCGHLREGCQTVRLGSAEKKVVTGRKAQLLLLEDREFFSYLWDKLFRKELFRDVIFPVGRKFEDQTVLFRIVGKADRVVCIPYFGYHYVETEGSTVYTYTLKNALDYYLAVRENRKDADDLGQEYRIRAEQNLLRAIIPVWAFAAADRNDPAAEQFRELYPEILRTVAGGQSLIADCPRTGILGKMILYGIAFSGKPSLKLLRPLGALYSRRHGNNERK